LTEPLFLSQPKMVGMLAPPQLPHDVQHAPT
jgi:hypothetical protein